MQHAAPRASWTVGSRFGVGVMALVWLGTTAWGVWPVPPAPGERAVPATVQVVVTDGTAARLWIERDGGPPRAMPLACETKPGPASLRVARLTEDGAWRQDTVEMDLQAGRLHLVPIGGRPVRIEVAGGREPLRPLPGAYPVPGVVDRPDAVLLPQPDDDTVALPEGERLLLVANPFHDEIRCRVAAQHGDAARDWCVQCTVPAFNVRVVALGEATDVQISTARADDGAILGGSRHSLPARTPCHLLYTVGGATYYRWVGPVAGTMPPAPVGEWAELPTDAGVRPRREGDPASWLLAAPGPGGRDVGLAALASAPLAVLGPMPSVQARADVVVRELALPATLQGRPVGAVAAAGDDVWGTVDGVVHDLRTGRPLHASGPVGILQMTATPHGLVMLTRGGRLATLRDGRIEQGVRLGDPTVLLAAADGDPPAVWVYGGVSTLLRQPLDGTQGASQTRWADGESFAVQPTAMAPACGGGSLAASGRSIERLRPRADAPGSFAVDSLLTLPEGTPDVVGLLDLDGRLLFATEECVYELRGDLVLPLAEGIGGPLVSWGGGVLVCDRGSGRLVHLSGPAFRSGGAR